MSVHEPTRRGLLAIEEEYPHIRGTLFIPSFQRAVAPLLPYTEAANWGITYAVQANTTNETARAFFSGYIDNLHFRIIAKIPYPSSDYYVELYKRKSDENTFEHRHTYLIPGTQELSGWVQENSYVLFGI